MLRPLTRCIVAGAIAAAFCSWTGPLYLRALSSVSELVAGIDPRLRHVDLKVLNGDVLMRGGAENPGLPLGHFPAYTVVYNFVLLVALFALNRRPLSRDTLRRFALATALLIGTHVLALAIAVESTYAAGSGAWGEARYALVERNFWSAALFSYRLTFMFAIPFGLWWWLNDFSEVRTNRARPAG